MPRSPQLPPHRLPIVSSETRRSAVSWNKHSATPELPLLQEAAHELAALGEFDLLPAAVVDTLGKLEAETPATGAPQSHDDFENRSEEDESEEDEDENVLNLHGRDYIMSPDRRIFVKHGFIDGEVREEVRRVRASSAPPSCKYATQPQADQQQATEAEDLQVPTCGMYAAWWCKLEQDRSGVQIRPLSNGRVDEAAIEDELAQAPKDISFMLLWCWLQPEAEEGRLRVVPCTTEDSAVFQYPHEPCATDRAEVAARALRAAVTRAAAARDEADVAQRFYIGDGLDDPNTPHFRMQSDGSSEDQSAPRWSDEVDEVSSTEASSVNDAEEAVRAETETTASVVSDEDFAPPAPPSGSYEPKWAPGPDLASSAPTTLVLSNLPAELEQDDLLEVLDRMEFSGCYDFVSLLPKEGSSRRSAVVNLTRHTWGLRLAAWIYGKADWGEGIGDGVSPCEVAWSTTDQGLNDLVRRYRDAAMDEEVPEEERPVLLSRGWEVSAQMVNVLRELSA